MVGQGSGLSSGALLPGPPEQHTTAWPRCMRTASWSAPPSRAPMPWPSCTSTSRCSLRSVLLPTSITTMSLLACSRSSWATEGGCAAGWEGGWMRRQVGGEETSKSGPIFADGAETRCAHPQPALDAVERLVPRDVVNQQRPHRAAVVAAGRVREKQ